MIRQENINKSHPAQGWVWFSPFSTHKAAWRWAAQRLNQGCSWCYNPFLPWSWLVFTSVVTLHTAAHMHVLAVRERDRKDNPTPTSPPVPPLVWLTAGRFWMCASWDKARINHHRFIIRLRGSQNYCENVFLHTEQQALSMTSTVFKCKHSRYSIRKHSRQHIDLLLSVFLFPVKGEWRNSHTKKFISTWKGYSCKTGHLLFCCFKKF